MRPRASPAGVKVDDWNRIRGGSPLPAAIDFKWADNIRQTGEASDFTLNGDAAPNDRFNYRAELIGPRNR